MTELETQPKSYYGLFVNHIERHYGTYGLVVVLFCGSVLALNILTLYHIYVSPVGWIAAAEAEAGWRLAEELIMPIVYVRMGTSLIGLVAGAMMLRRR